MTGVQTCALPIYKPYTSKGSDGKKATADEVGTMNKGEVYTITNSPPPKQTGALTISKTIEGATAEPNKLFYFTIKLDPAKDGLVTYGVDGTKLGQIDREVDFKDGVGKIALKAGETVRIVGIPAGTKYEVIESDSTFWRSEERRVGKECRSRWSPYH